MELKGKIFANNSIPIAKIQDWDQVLIDLQAEVDAHFADLFEYLGIVLINENTALTGLTTVTINGVVTPLVNKQRLLLKAQTNALENGLYTYNSTADTLTRVYEIADLEIINGLQLVNNQLSIKLSALSGNMLSLDAEGKVFVRIDPSQANGLVFSAAGLGIDPNGLPIANQEITTQSINLPYITAISASGGATSEQYQQVTKTFTISGRSFRHDSTVEVSILPSQRLIWRNIRNLVRTLTAYVNTLQFEADLIALDDLLDPIPIGTYQNIFRLKNNNITALSETNGYLDYITFSHEIVVPTAFIITNITWTGNWVQGTAKNLTIALSDNAAIGAPYTYSVPAWLTVNSVVTNTEGVLVLSVTPTSYGNLSGNITVTASGVGTPTTPAYSISLYASVPSITAQIGDIYEPTRTSSFITNYGSTIVVGGLYNGGSSEFDVITQSDSYPTNTYFSFNKIGALVQTFASNGGAISPGHPYKYFYGTYGITNVTRKTNHEVSDFDYYVVITYSEIGIYGGTRGTATYSIHSKNEGIIGTASVDFDFYPVYSGPPLTGIFVGRTRPVSIEFGFLNGVATIGVYTNVGWSYFVSTQVPSTGYYAAMISPAIENNNAVVPVTLAQTSYAGHWIAG